jgi:hypothetical protein
MSASNDEPFTQGSTGGGVSTDISPKLKQGSTELEPVATTRLGGTLPWDRDSVQLQCGETVSSTNGDLNLRLNMEAVVTKTQLEKLNSMRANPTNVFIVSDAYTGRVTFDEFKFDRVTDANSVTFPDRVSDDTPMYTIQLQSKEEDDE